MSVGNARVGEYAGWPGVAVGRVVSTNCSWRTVNANGRPASGDGGVEVLDAWRSGKVLGFAGAAVHALAASAHIATTAQLGTKRDRTPEPTTNVSMTRTRRARGPRAERRRGRTATRAA
jgi:hypothetical protein